MTGNSSFYSQLKMAKSQTMQTLNNGHHISDDYNLRTLRRQTVAAVFGDGGIRANGNPQRYKGGRLDNILTEQRSLQRCLNDIIQICRNINFSLSESNMTCKQGIKRSIIFSQPSGGRNIVFGREDQRESHLCLGRWKLDCFIFSYENIFFQIWNKLKLDLLFTAKKELNSKIQNHAFDKVKYFQACQDISQLCVLLLYMTYGRDWLKVYIYLDESLPCTEMSSPLPQSWRVEQKSLPATRAHCRTLTIKQFSGQL